MVPEIRTKNQLSLTAFGHAQRASRWRTEAMRSHAAPRLLFFAKGHGRITVAGLTGGYGPNNLVYVPANTMYGYEAGPMCFGQSLAIPHAMSSEWPDAHVHLRLRDVASQKELAQIFDSLERELKSDLMSHTRAALYLVGLMSIFFQRQMDQHKPEDRQDTAPARLVAAYTDLIERDFRSTKGIAEFAAALGVTPTHLTRCCNITCGRSALALLNDRVTYEARRLLRDTASPVQTIAAGLGFSSPAYFTRSFQGQTGMTPTAFRKHGMPT